MTDKTILTEEEGGAAATPAAANVVGTGEIALKDNVGRPIDRRKELEDSANRAKELANRIVKVKTKDE